MTEVQNMQNTQQQQQQYVNPQVYRTEATLSNGVLGAVIDVQFTANLVKELLEREIYFYYDNVSIRWIHPENKYLSSKDVEGIIREAAIKKVLQTNQQKGYYKIVLDVEDVIPAIDQLIKEREEEERIEEEREKKIREEKNKIIEQIKQKLTELKEVIKEEGNGFVRLIDGTSIYFREGDSLQDLQYALEKVNNTDAYKVLKNVISKLEEEKKELEEQNSRLYREIRMLKNIVRKLVSEEELESRKEELEEQEEEELTKQEVEYLLKNVFDC